VSLSRIARAPSEFPPNHTNSDGKSETKDGLDAKPVAINIVYFLLLLLLLLVSLSFAFYRKTDLISLFIHLFFWLV